MGRPAGRNGQNSLKSSIARTFRKLRSGLRRHARWELSGVGGSGVQSSGVAVRGEVQGLSSTETEIPLPETQPASEPLPGPPDSDWSVEPAALVRPSRRLARRAAAAALIVAVLLAAYLALGAWLQTGPAQDIQVFVVTRRSFPIVLEEKGELKATNSVDIKSELQGRATIISLVDEGVHVQKGDLLVELASDEIDERIRTWRSARRSPMPPTRPPRKNSKSSRTKTRARFARRAWPSRWPR